MQVSREEILHIAKLACLKLNDDEVDVYLNHLQDILNFAEKVNNAPTEGLSETIGANEKSNAFREDKVIEFEDINALLENAPTKERGMIKLPKVIQ